MAEYFTLQEICSKSDFVLIDTCSFLAPIGFSTDRGFPIEKKIERATISNENLSFLIEKIPSCKNIYTTEEIVKEIRALRYNYKKAIKLPVFDNGNKGIVLKLRRELSENKKNKVRLSNLLEGENRVFKMNSDQQEVYNSLSEKYSFFIDKLKLSKQDLGLLLLGGALSKENIISVISNDFGIRDAWKLFLKREDYLRGKLNFYSNCDSNFFRKA